MRLLTFLLLVGCGTSFDPPTRTTFGGDRPVELDVSERYDHREPSPLLILLHGYAIAGDWQNRYLGFFEIVDEQNFLLAVPDGSRDRDQRLFWNATEACCNFYGEEVDDVGYITGLIDEISTEYNVDERRVFLFGHSNGGFLANRIACEQSEKIAAIATLAGVREMDASRCQPTAKLSVLHLHGTDDQIIPYPGGRRPEAAEAHPGAEQNVSDWARDLGCDAERAQMAQIDLDAHVRADETTVERAQGCEEGIDVELWRIEGGGHIPTVTTGSAHDTFARRVWRFFEDHPKLD